METNRVLSTDSIGPWNSLERDSLAELSGNPNEKFGWRQNWLKMIVVNIARRRGTIDKRTRRLIFPFLQFVLQTEKKKFEIETGSYRLQLILLHYDFLINYFFL